MTMNRSLKAIEEGTRNEVFIEPDKVAAIQVIAREDGPARVIFTDGGTIDICGSARYWSEAVSKIKPRSWECPHCGQYVGWLGRVFPIWGHLLHGYPCSEVKAKEPEPDLWTIFKPGDRVKIRGLTDQPNMVIELVVEPERSYHTGEPCGVHLIWHDDGLLRRSVVHPGALDLRGDTGTPIFNAHSGRAS